MSVNSKPDHPPGHTPGEFFKSSDSPPPEHKESGKPQPLGQKNRAKTPPRGNYFQKSSKKKHKTWDRNFEKQYWNVNMFRNIKTVKHIEAQSFLVSGFYGYSKYLKYSSFIICIYHLLRFLNRSVFVGFRTFICEPGCNQVMPSPVIHIKHQIHRYIEIHWLLHYPVVAQKSP